MLRKSLTLALILTAGASAAWAQSGAFVFGEDQVDEIIGKVQKPEIQLLVTRENLNKDYELELKESFIPRIIESVEKKPF